MGGHYTKPTIPIEILQAEVDNLMTKSRCSPAMEEELNREISVMLLSLDPNIVLPESSALMLNQTSPNQQLDQQVKAVLLDQINEFELSREVNERFFDSNLFAVVNCLYANLLTVDKTLFQATPSTIEYFRPTDNLSIGQWGLVLKAKNGGSEMSFIIKTQTNPNESDLSIHEAFIAITCTNPLRAFCPNFSYLYGGFTCGKPDGINAKICTGQELVPYTIYENVPGSTFLAFLSGTSPGSNIVFRQHPYGPPASPPNPFYLMVLSILLQIYFALKIAHAKAYQFSHRDLHAENIILRPLQQTMILKYDSTHFIPEDVLETIQIKLGNLPPRTPPVDARSVYYVKANSVATIIDYDMAEAYLPYIRADGTYAIRQHGMGDRDPFGKPVTGDPEISHIRDLTKLLGFTANGVLNNKTIGNDFKEMICDLYIDTVRPYYTVTAQPGQHPPLVQDKIKLIVRDAKTKFSLSENQIVRIKSKEIYFDRFIDNFARLVPPTYLAEVSVRHMIDPQLDQQLEDQIRQQTGLNILGCAGVCPSETETYRKLTDPLHKNETKALEAASQQHPEVLAFQLMNAHLSRLRFQQSPVRIPAIPGQNPLDIMETTPNGEEGKQVLPGTVEYRQLVQERLDEFTKLATPDVMLALNSSIQVQLNMLDRMVTSINLPNPNFFPEDEKMQRGELYKYKLAINNLFELMKRTREIIIMHNASVILNAPFAAQNRQNILRTVNAVNQLIQLVIFPWRNLVNHLIRSNSFGRLNDEMAIVISTKFPTNITFDPIL